MNDAELAAINQHVLLDDNLFTRWADSLPESIINEALALIEKDELELYDQANEYEDEELGHWAERKIITLPFNITIGTAKQLMVCFW